MVEEPWLLPVVTVEAPVEAVADAGGGPIITIKINKRINKCLKERAKEKTKETKREERERKKRLRTSRGRDVNVKAAGVVLVGSNLPCPQD